jgi:chromosome segregation ATPase
MRPSDKSDMTEQIFVYTTERRKEDWKAEAEHYNQSLSEFIQDMTEAGRKKFNAQVTPDESVTELREQRNRLRRQLREANRRIEDLEDQRVKQIEGRLDRGQRGAIIEFVEENPGVHPDDIRQHLKKTIEQWLKDDLTVLEGNEIRREGELYYPVEDDDSQ